MKIRKEMLTAAAVLTGILLSGCCCPFSCCAPNAKLHAAPAPGAVTIDGKIDANEWKGAESYAFAALPLYIPQHTPPKCAASIGIDPLETGKVQLMYDAKYLYIAAELTDSDLIQYAGTSNMSLSRGGDWFQVSLKPENLPSWWVCGVAPDGRSASELIESRGYPVKKEPVEMKGLLAKVSAKGTLNNYKDKDTGWTLEMAIPLAELARLGSSFNAPWTVLISRMNSNYGSIEGFAQFSSVPQLPKQDIRMYEYYADLIPDTLSR